MTVFADAVIVGAGLGFGMAGAAGITFGLGWLFWDGMRKGQR